LARTVAALIVVFAATGAAILGGPAALQASAQEEVAAAIVEGSCDSLGNTAADLRPLTAAAGGALTSFTTVDLAVTDLAGGGYAVVAGDPAAPSACGEIAGEGDDLYVTLRAQGGGKLGGIAWLHAREDRTQVSLFMSEELGGSSATPTEEPSDQPEPPADETPVPIKTPQANATQAAGETETYTSPIYGHTITYDTGVWNVLNQGTDRDQGGPIDFFVLSAGVDAIQVEFYGLQPARGDTALDIVANMERNILTSPELIDPAIRSDAGGDEDHAFVAIDFTFEDESGDRYSNVYHIEVWAMPAVDGALIMVYQTPQDVYEDWIPAREILVRGITLPE